MIHAGAGGVGQVALQMALPGLISLCQPVKKNSLMTDFYKAFHSRGFDLVILTITVFRGVSRSASKHGDGSLISVVEIVGKKGIETAGNGAILEERDIHGRRCCCCLVSSSRCRPESHL